MISRIGSHHRCRNTRLELAEERGWLVVRMVDKCTGASYEATFSPATAKQVAATLAEQIDRISHP